MSEPSGPVLPELTPRQIEVVEFVRDWHDRYGYAPTVRDIASGLVISINGAWGHLQRLEQLRVLEHAPGVARSIRIRTDVNLHEILKGGK